MAWTPKGRKGQSQGAERAPTGITIGGWFIDCLQLTFNTFDTIEENQQISTNFQDLIFKILLNLKKKITFDLKIIISKL